MKLILSTFVLPIIIGILIFPAYSDTSQISHDITVSKSHAQNLPLIVDGANLLSEIEKDRLLKKLIRIKEIDRVEIIIVTRTSLGKKSASEYANDFFEYNGYGPDSLVFLISIQERVWAVSTHGNAAEIFDNDTISSMMDIVFLHLSGDHFYKAFELFIDTCSRILYGHKYDIPIDLRTAEYKMNLLDFIPVNILIAFVLSLILLKKLRYPIKKDSTLSPDAYPQGTNIESSVMFLTLSSKSDIFMSSNTAKTKID